MARTHARLLSSVWHDEDHTTLTIVAQWLYAYLLAHPKLTLVGSLDLRPKRWAKLAVDATEDQVLSTVGTLAASRHLLVDWDTDEIVVRTFTRHAVGTAGWNRNLTTGFWRQWDDLESDFLRSEVVHEVPAELWELIGDDAPDQAKTIRQTPRSPRLEPDPPPRLEPPLQPPSEPQTAPRSGPISRSVDQLSKTSSQSYSRPDAMADVGEAAQPTRLTPSERVRLVETAYAIIGQDIHDEAMADGKVHTSPDGHLNGCIAGAKADYAEKANALVSQHPEWSPEQLAHALTRNAVPFAESNNPTVVQDRQWRERVAADTAPAATPEQKQSAAELARANLQAAARGEFAEEVPA